MARANGIFSESRRYEPFTFQIGADTVIKGYEISTRLLGEGGEGFFYVPSTLAYRNSPSFLFERNEILKMRIKVIEID